MPGIYRGARSVISDACNPRKMIRVRAHRGGGWRGIWVSARQILPSPKANICVLVCRPRFPPFLDCIPRESVFASPTAPTGTFAWV